MTVFTKAASFVGRNYLGGAAILGAGAVLPKINEFGYSLVNFANDPSYLTAMGRLAENAGKGLAALTLDAALFFTGKALYDRVAGGIHRQTGNGA